MHFVTWNSAILNKQPINFLSGSIKKNRYETPQLRLEENEMLCLLTCTPMLDWQAFFYFFVFCAISVKIWKVNWLLIDLSIDLQLSAMAAESLLMERTSFRICKPVYNIQLREILWKYFKNCFAWPGLPASSPHKLHWWKPDLSAAFL